MQSKLLIRPVFSACFILRWGPVQAIGGKWQCRATQLHCMSSWQHYEQCINATWTTGVFLIISNRMHGCPVYLRCWLVSSSSEMTTLETSPVEKLAFSSAVLKSCSAAFFFLFPNRRLNGWNLPCRRLSAGRKRNDNQSYTLSPYHSLLSHPWWTV
jgi:hypothetical protein